MNKRVLVVDDNPVSQKITAGLIHSAGFETDTVESAEQALEKLAQSPPDLLITSLRLPGMDGLDLTRAVKNLASGKAIPVILLTAAYSAEEEAEAVGAGCECALAKPVDVEHFPGMIALYLGAPASLPAHTESAGIALPLQELRDEFLSTSAEECRQILAGFGDAADYAAIRKALHRWAGVGGTLGFPSITTTARELESLAADPHGEKLEDLGLGLSELMDLFTTAEPAEAAAVPGASAAQAVPAKSKAPVVLISDDDPLVRGAIQHALESSGYRCRVAADGATTFAMARADAPDVIVLDINMPQMNGFQVLYALRSAWATRTVPVLMLTASHDESDVRRGGLLGASDYMTKPFDPDALVGRIDRMLMK